eukprot:gene2235-4344_t
MQCFSGNARRSCDYGRGQRISANVQALNEFYLKSIFLNIQSSKTSKQKSITIMNKASPKLTVIDAYSIAVPRLIFNEGNEVTCLNHYLCRVHNKGNGSSTLDMVHTPAGNAILQTILHVIEDNLLL